MIARIRISRLVMAMLLAVATMIAAQASFAQPVFPNPPCTGVKVQNFHTSCTAQLRFVTVPATWPALFTLAPGASIGMPAGVTVTGLTDVFGTTHAFNPPPPTITGCGPNAWWMTGIYLNTALACSFRVCADPTTCTITVY